MRPNLLSRCLLFLSACCGASAAEAPPIAAWTAGSGTIADHPAAGQSAVAAGELLRASADAPARVELAAPATVSVTLAPGSAVRIAPGGAGDRDLSIEVVEGAAQVEVVDKGSWRSVLVRAGGAEARALKSVLLAEHAGANGYLALVRGALQVHAADGKDAATWRPLKPHQGVAADGATLSAAEDLAARPQLDQAKRPALRDQGKADDAASWHRDNATAVIAASLIHDDAAAAAWLAASLARVDSPAGADVAAHAAARAPELAADLAAAVVACAPASANDVVAATVGAAPDQAPAVVGAVAAITPDSAPDLAVAAMTAVPAKAKDIILAAIKAAPASKDAIIGVASALAPEAADAAQAAP